MNLPDAWKRYKATRDNGHSLTDTPIREAAITRARFRKAVLMTNILIGGTPTDWPDDPEEFSDEMWAALMLTAGIDEASPATRVLIVELYRDRVLQREGLHADGPECIEYVTGNFTPAELFGRPN